MIEKRAGVKLILSSFLYCRRHRTSTLVLNLIKLFIVLLSADVRREVHHEVLVMIMRVGSCQCLREVIRLVTISLLGLHSGMLV